MMEQRVRKQPVSRHGDCLGRLLVLSEKHALRYFDVDTEAKLHAAALHILRRRVESGFYREPTKPAIDQVMLDMTDADVAALKSEGVRYATVTEIRRQKRALALYGTYLTEYQDMLRACEEGDGALAWRILLRRSGYEYEDFEVVQLEPVPTGDRHGQAQEAAPAQVDQAVTVPPNAQSRPQKGAHRVG